MADRVIRGATQLLVGLHLLAWFAVAANWALAWHDGAGPSGPQYNSAKDFIGSLDIVVHCNVDRFSMKAAQNAATWFSADLGACYAIAFACLILLAGTLQWFLLARLAQWIAVRKGRALALALLDFYAVWAALALFFWVAS